MNILIIEIIGCLFAAAFLSLFIGWAIRSSLATRETEAVRAQWQSKHAELELRYKQDTEHLEDQVQQLKTDTEQLSERNDSITESLRQNEMNVHKARADAIELNRQQADTQERLQRIIAQKDEELKLFRTNGSGVSAAAGLAAANTDTTEAKIASLSAKREAWEAERARLLNGVSEDQATIAIDPADLPTDPSAQLDQTVRIDAEQMAELKNRTPIEQTMIDEDADKTLTLDEDSTILLDNKYHKQPTPGGTPDDNDG